MGQPPVVVTLEGHLTRASLEAALSRTAAQLTVAGRGVIVDCTSMTGYEIDAREAFVAWNRKHAKTVAGVAIVTENPLHRIVIAAMRLASGQALRPFANDDEARSWLATL